MPAGGSVPLRRDTSEAQPATTYRRAARALASLDIGCAVFAGGGRFVTANERHQELFPGIGEVISTGCTDRGCLARIERDFGAGGASRPPRA
jgi:hypothetical protein